MKMSENNNKIIFIGKPDSSYATLIFSGFIALKYSLFLIFALVLYASHLKPNSFEWTHFFFLLSLNIIGILLSKRAFINLFHREIWKITPNEMEISLRFIIQYQNIRLRASEIKRVELVESVPFNVENTGAPV